MSSDSGADASATPGVVDLMELGHDLLGLARAHTSRRAARTLMSSPSMRATVIALARGAELAEHDAPPAATLQVLTGVVRLHTEDHEWSLSQGDVVAIPPARHGLLAGADAVLLLTVALR